MEKYKQKYIPEVEIPKEWRKMRLNDLKIAVGEFYKKNIQGWEVLNIDKGFRITFSSQGRQKLTRGSAMYSKKAAVMLILKELLEAAEYSNFGRRKGNDPAVLMGYLNFKAKCKIDGKIETVRFACMLYRADKIYFNHEINMKISKKGAES